MTSKRWILFSGLLLALILANAAKALELAGLPLVVKADSTNQAKFEQALKPRVEQLERVAQQLEQLNRDGKLTAPSVELLELLTLCEQWQNQLHNAFSCRLGALQKDWQAAEINGELLDRAALRQKARNHLKLQWRADKTEVHLSNEAQKEGLQLNLHGLWHGWVLDQLATEAKRISAQQKLALDNISFRYGDLLLLNKTDLHSVVIEGLSPLQLTLDKQALVVLDRQKNLRKVGHYWLSRKLVSKEGWPVEFAPSLLVRASSAVQAGVMAQALITMPISAALEQADKVTGVEALAITETGMFFASQEWYSAQLANGTSPWKPEQRFQIEYEIPALDVAEYRRPYLAIWITDSEGKSIRQLQVLGDSSRWLRELRSWWRKIGRADDSLIDALAGATRKPGSYTLLWDGRDAHGNFVIQGNYELHIEAAREHGEHESIVLPFSLTGKTLKETAKGNKEIGSVRLSLH